MRLPGEVGSRFLVLMSLTLDTALQIGLFIKLDAGIGSRALRRPLM